MAQGNHMADLWAGRAATVPGHPLWSPLADLHGDAVLLVSSSGQPILSVAEAASPALWQRARASSPRHPRLDLLFPPDLSFNWTASTVVFRRPTAAHGTFASPAPIAVTKWVARVRCGCLVTQDRLHRRRDPSGLPLVPSPACLCCGAALDNDSHVLDGCPATGSTDWLHNISAAWHLAAAALKLQVLCPPSAWIQSH
jgi:hypothetical protein